jgi:hypothetical protein
MLLITMLGSGASSAGRTVYGLDGAIPDERQPGCTMATVRRSYLCHALSPVVEQLFELGFFPVRWACGVGGRRDSTAWVCGLLAACKPDETVLCVGKSWGAACLVSALRKTGHPARLLVTIDAAQGHTQWERVLNDDDEMEPLPNVARWVNIRQDRVSPEGFPLAVGELAEERACDVLVPAAAYSPTHASVETLACRLALVPDGSGWASVPDLVGRAGGGRP